MRPVNNRVLDGGVHEEQNEINVNLLLTFSPKVIAHLCCSLYHSFLNMARVPVMSFCKPVHPPPVDINEESLSAV